MPPSIIIFSKFYNTLHLQYVSQIWGKFLVQDKTCNWMNPKSSSTAEVIFSRYVAYFCQITSGNSIIVCTLHRSDWARKRQQAAPNLVSSQPRSPHHYRASLHENFRNEPYCYHCARRGCCLCSRRGRLWSTVLLLLILLLLWPQSSLFITFVIISDCWHKK